jgi:hypothetical protein
MSPLVLMAVPVLAVIMVCFAYLSNSKERIAAQNIRMMAKYKDRARKLDKIVIGLPATYLPKTLRTLIHAYTLDSIRKIHRISGKGDLAQQLAGVKQTLESASNADAKQEETASLSVPALIECKHLLKDLHSLIIDFHADRTLDRDAAQAQLQAVRRAMLIVTLDTFKQAANTALADNNIGLALHHCSTALNRLNQDPSETGLEKDKTYFTDQVLKLEQQIQTRIDNPDEPSAPSEAVSAEWQEISQPDDSWKKRRF